MKILYQSLLLTLALVGTASAQVPNTNDTSTRAGDNTGMGTGALGGPRPSNLTGTENTAAGFEALYSDTIGNYNTAFGVQALYMNTMGIQNTATGYQALYAGAGGSQNTAIGNQALYTNYGGENTAAGIRALYLNTTGGDNSAFGAQALYSNTEGNFNTGSGAYVLYYNTLGSYNTASGYQALHSNTSGNYNTASGTQALHNTTSGSYNTASGYDALYYNTTGKNNTATGRGALQSNKNGSNNIAEGYHAGLNLTSGSNNIDIGNQGVAAESGIIRIGTAGTQTATYVAGVTGVVATGTLAPVYVNASGQLSVGPPSAERFKTAIALMGESTARLGELRPVTFQYKSDPHGARQYGLIAEEVAKVYPELVIRDAKGQILTVHYDELAPMLLNEVQKQQIKNAGQEARIRDLEQQVAKMHAALLKLQSKDERVAQR
jgi:hypothetical protein